MSRKCTVLECFNAYFRLGADLGSERILRTSPLAAVTAMCVD
jgi:hypothetical protein